jgi:cation:H+ antiporter
MISIGYIIIGLLLLILGGEMLVKSSVGLSFKMNLSKLIIGMTVVSFATSAPELIVSLKAALNNHPAIALGNVIGSNIANIALVLGLTAIIAPLTVSKDFYKMNWPMLAFVSVLLYVFLKNDLLLSRLEGGILFVSLIAFIYVMISNYKKKKNKIDDDEVDDDLAKVGYGKIFVWLAIGGFALWLGSDWLVKGAVDIANQYGVSERIISVSMIALGTSIPELAASIIAALKKEKAISLGNLIGSNIFNIASVLGLTAMIKPIPVLAEDLKLLEFDIFWMLAIAIGLLPLVLLPKKMEISWVKGVLLFAAYISFLYLTFSQTTIS